MPIPFHPTDSAAWAASAGLKPEVVLEVDGYIRKQAYARSRMAAFAGLGVEDLIQEGRVGALKAAIKFNPSVGTKFLTYAAFWINAAIGEAVQQRTIRTPRGNAQVLVMSYDEPIQGKDGEESGTRRDSLADEAMDFIQEATRAEAMGRIRRALSCLEARDRKILIQHYGLSGQAPKSLQEIAHELGLSRQRISQILERGMAVLRQRALGLAA